MKKLTSLAFCVMLIASVPVLTSFKAAPAVSTEKELNGGGITIQLFEDSVQHLYDSIGLAAYELPYEAFRLAMVGYYDFKSAGSLGNQQLLTIIDFTQPSTQKRFYTVDLTNYKVVFNTYVSHGKNTGENYAKSFSNRVHSNQSSLGFYITGETYVGSKGYSLRLDGMDPGYNDNIRNRAVVMHDAEYVSEKWIQQYGRLGRSQGCPALPKEISRKVIDTIKEKTLVFAYADDKQYLSSSTHLNLEQLLQKYQVVAP